MARPAASVHLDAASLPDPVRSPGEMAEGVKTDSLCAEAEPTSLPADALCTSVFADVRIPETRRYQYECTFLVPPAIGGARTKKNVWAQPAEEALLKRDLDREMRKRLCRKEIALSQAQKELVNDWAGAYRKYVLTGDVPVVAYEQHAEDTGRRRPSPETPVSPVSLQTGGSLQPRESPGGRIGAADLAQPEGTPPIEANVSMGGQSNGLQNGGSSPGRTPSQGPHRRGDNGRPPRFEHPQANPMPRAPAAAMRRPEARPSFQATGRGRSGPAFGARH